LKDLSGIAHQGSALLAIPQSSGELGARKTSTILLNDFSLCANVWSTLFSVVKRSGIFFTVFTGTFNKKSLVHITSWFDALHAVISALEVWRAFFEHSIDDELLSSETSGSLACLSIGGNSFVVTAW